MIVAGENRAAQLLKRFDAVMQHVPTARLLDAKQVLELVPYLAEGCWNAGIYEASAYDLDVHGIHGAYVTGLRERGALVVREAEMMAGEYRNGGWHLRRGQHALDAGRFAGCFHTAMSMIVPQLRAGKFISAFM